VDRSKRALSEAGKNVFRDLKLLDQSNLRAAIAAMKLILLAALVLFTVFARECVAQADIYEALKGVSAQLRSNSDSVRLAATKELARVALTPSNHAIIMESEAFLYTIAQLFSDSPDVRVASLHVIGILGPHEENQQKIIDAEIIPMIVKLIDDDLEAQSLAAIQTLGNLAHNPSAQELAGNSNAVEKVTPFLKHPSDKMRRIAAGALGNLAIHKPNCERIKQAGGIPLLVSLISRPAYPEAEASTAETAVGALRNLLVDENLVDDLVAAKIVPGLVELTRTGSEASKEIASDLMDFLSQEVAELQGGDLQDEL
jgi:hypothetical protein